MDTIQVLISVATLFAYIIPGFVLGKTTLVEREKASSTLSTLLLYAASPSLTTGACMRAYDGGLFVKGLLAFASCAALIVLMFFAGRLFRHGLDEERGKVLHYASMFGNIGFMGIPVLGAAFGDDGVFCGTFMLLAFNILNWTLGVRVFSREKSDLSVKKMLVNPGTVGGLIGIVLFLLPVAYPEPLVSAVKTLGSLTGPLSMIMIGFMLSGVKARVLFSGKEIYFFGVLRMLLLPVLTAAILSLVGAPALVTGCMTVASAMPVATSTGMFAIKFNGDYPYAARTVLVTVLISAVTMPFLLWIRDAFFPNLF